MKVNNLITYIIIKLLAMRNYNAIFIAHEPAISDPFKGLGTLFFKEVKLLSVNLVSNSLTNGRNLFGCV